MKRCDPVATAGLYATHDQWHVTAAVERFGTVVERYAYDGFGGSLVLTAGFSTRSASLYAWETRFGAYRFDDEANLYYVRFRYLQPSLGRWLSRDPIEEEGGSNFYGYVGDNPLFEVDPLGLDYILLNRSWGGKGFGHSGSLIGNSKTGYTYYTKDGHDPNDNRTGHFASLDKFLTKYGKEYDRSQTVPTTEDQDKAMLDYADKHLHDQFHTHGNNCKDFSNKIMEAGGITPPFGVTPNAQFSSLYMRMNYPPWMRILDGIEILRTN